MEEGAEWLCERALPLVPLRQWVLSLPKVLRYLLASDGELCCAVAKTAMQDVFHYQRLRARRALGLSSTQLAPTGAMAAVQRFGSALNLNIHFHALVLDGVFVLDASVIRFSWTWPHPLRRIFTAWRTPSARRCCGEFHRHKVALDMALEMPTVESMRRVVAGGLGVPSFLESPSNRTSPWDCSRKCRSPR